ncbi:hypothetical protein ACFFJ7_19140, partial [Pseudochelatococcus lubricantis]|uniref:hypothetical protein n=1 Tax=Pseudochelatococcus lubricantis TaxID=1538102 RepID=UPI0035EF1B80
LLLFRLGRLYITARELPGGRSISMNIVLELNFYTVFKHRHLMPPVWMKNPQDWHLDGSLGAAWHTNDC